MMLSEFNEATGADLTPEQYKTIESVYIYHPIFDNVCEGVLPVVIKTAKDLAYLLYKIGGLQIFRDLEAEADAMKVFSDTLRSADDYVVKDSTQAAINALYMRYE